MREKLYACNELLYRVFYILGVETLLFFIRAGKRAAAYFRPIGRGLYRAVDWLLLRHVRAIGREAVRFVRGFAAVPRYIKARGWRAVDLPVLPISPSRSPCATFCPFWTYTAEQWAYMVWKPLPWSILTYKP